LPIDAPPGRWRLRLRADNAAVLYVRTDSGTRAYWLEVSNGRWRAFGEFGRNELLAPIDTTRAEC
jgi:hypothetical protein